MLFASIRESDSTNLSKFILQANAPVDGFEIRLDYLKKIDLEILRQLVKSSSKPLLFTLRRGKFSGSEQEREAWIKKLVVNCSPAYFDLEWDSSRELFQFCREHTKIISSFHDFAETPDDLETLFIKMQMQDAFAYKIATQANSILDAMKMLIFVKSKVKEGKKLSGICMGEKGQISRILGPVFGNYIDYTYLDSTEPTALGQISVQDLCNTYHYRSLNPQTILYGLLGDPIVQSVSHQTHNAYFRLNHLNAVYVKLHCHKEELKTCISLVKKMGFKGCSVTMPHKEEIISCIDRIDPYAEQIGAVNTLVFDAADKITGFNTDARGALDAIEAKRKMKGKTIVLIGAGGAARALAYEAKQRGAHLILLGRDRQRAKQFAEKFGCRLHFLDEMQKFSEESYDCIINCTPDAAPIDSRYILDHSLVMDINTKHKETPFLLDAKKKNCQIVYGSEMFINQARGQYALWFKQPLLLFSENCFS